MAAFMVVLLKNRNTHWLADYIANVPSIFRKYGGEYAGVSKSVKSIEGTLGTPESIAIFNFPSAAKIEEFMACEEYRPYKEIRQLNSDADIFIFDAASLPIAPRNDNANSS